MSVILKKQLGKECLLGLWEISEDYDTLRSMIDLEEPEIISLESFRNRERQLEYLSVRALLSEITNPSARIIYNGVRKPFLEDNSYNISISHSNRLTAILVSKSRRVGIDTEYMSHKISKIAHKFISEKEYVTEEEELRKQHLYIHWCAKEALYKLSDKKHLSFKQNLLIQPFQLNKEGSIRGIIENNLSSENFDLNYFTLDNYIIVWCCKK